ncbi:hypothetical protein D1872_301710 [compost metagenome]
MGGHRVPQLIHRIHHNADSRVETDRVVRKRNIVIDRPRQAHCLDTQLAQLLGALVGSVPADHDQAVDAAVPQNLRALLLTFRRLELQAAGRLQNRAPTLDNIADTADIHGEDIIV